MKKFLLLTALTLPGMALAQDAFSDAFPGAIRPMTAPTIFDLAVPRTQIHAIYMHQRMPNSVHTVAADVPLGGDFNLYALQFEIALNERTSIVAVKDGYIDFNPDSTSPLNSGEGFANLGLGLKRALIYKPESGYIMSGIATVEIPIGSDDVWQGEGDGALNLNLSSLKLADNFQLASNLGLHIPFDDSQSLTGSVSLHASYEVTPMFIPLIELNWFHTFDEGDGSTHYGKQLGSTVPAIVEFEGGDLINLGSANAGENRDTVLLGLGFRSRLNECATLGFAYEFPLTEEKDGLMRDRLTVDFVWKF